MCGIAGILYKNMSPPKSILEAMINTLEHRGPDNLSTYYDNNLGLAHSRLSIIGLDSSSNQPMHDSTKRYSIVFNGEIFNYIDIKEKLLKKGVRFNTSGDTEVLLNGFIHYGLEILKIVQGFYAFCIFDHIKQELVIARDVIGKKPLYLYKDKEKILFGSEIKAIKSVIYKNVNIDYSSMAHFLWKGYYANGDSAYSEIKSLLPGQVIKINIQTFKIEELVGSNLNMLRVSNSYEDRDIDKVKTALIKSIKSRMVSDVPVSYLLSGGVDSTIISYLAASELSKPLETYYVGYVEDDYDFFEELSVKISKSLHSNHKVLKMSSPNIDFSLNLMIKIFDEPFGDFSALPSYELYNQISSNCKVVISGDGADEIFCGYKDAKYHLLKSYIGKVAYQGKSDWLLSKIYSLVNSRSKSIRYAGFLFAIAFLDDKRYSLAAYRGGWNLNHRKSFLTDEGFDLLGGSSVEKIEEESFYSSGNNFIERYLNYDLKRLTYDFLVKVDRTSMANSVEVRSPFLDLNMINSLNGVRRSNMVDLTNTKKELKSILKSVGLNEVTNVAKKGFTPPLADWLINKSGRNSIENMIEDKASVIHKIFQTNKLQELTSSTALIRENYSRVWYLLLLHKWHKENFS